MFVFVNFLKRQSPPQQLPSFGHGSISLQDGRRWNPANTPKNKEAFRESK
ncbi:phage filamentation protein Fil family protein [Pantoea sp. CTOTU50773]|nr:phage filamentation protein Fil family protein [Pantoea sp. CTOTU50773]